MSANFSMNRGRTPVAMGFPTNRPSSVHAGREVEDECVLECHNVAFHSEDLRDVGYPAGAVLQPA